MIFTVPWIPLVVGTIISMALGAMWYSNVLFAKPWMKEAGVTMEEINASSDQMGKVYAFTALGALATAYVVGFLMVNLKIMTLGNAVIFALLLWIGTNVPPMIKNWGFENRTIKLGIINHGYDLAIYLIVAILYTFFI